MTAIIIFIMLALCVTAASAATLNNNLVVSRATLQIATTTTAPPGTCPAGCSCMMESDAKEKFGTYSRCSDTPCYTVMTGSTALKAYCFRQGTPPTTTTPATTCPEGCNCLSDAQAKDRYGEYTRCSSDICGYVQSAATNALSSSQVPKYCVKQGSTTPACPEDCSCISEATAKAKGGSWSRCSADICGYEQSTATLAAVVQVPKYCMKQQEATPACPEGCVCITDAMAKERYGTYTRCQADPCGYEMSTLTTAAYQIPKYCVKQGSTPICPDGCTCISDEDAKLKGLTERCDNSQTPCGYKTADATTTSAARRIPLFCYKIPTTTPACPQGCYCLQEADAKLKFGPNNYTRCKPDICGYDPSATTANGIPKYCFKPTITPTPAVCPQGCVCTTDEIAKIKGLTPCRGTRTSCGYDEKKQPLYCFEQVPSPTCVYDYQKNVCTGSCPQGYTCGVLASEKDATGKTTYAVCGCTGQPTGQCTFDKEKNACAGACQNGLSCTVVGKNVDEKTGEVSVTCGCPPPSSEQCTFDKEKQTCTGTCQSGAACAIIGKKTDDKTGEVYVFCGCPPQQGSCSYDYSREACAGTCTVTGDNCQLNTIYRDPTTGKVTYAECHCKGGGETTPACACDAAIGSCTGTCASGKACTMTERTTDNAGKVVCKSCGCTDTCVLDANNRCSGTCPQGGQCTSITTKDDSGQEKVSCGCGGQAGTPAGAATRQPGILEAIGSFFNKLFGGK